MKPTIILVAIRSALLGGAFVGAVSATSLTAAEPAATERGTPPLFSFQELTFKLPGSEWKKSGEDESPPQIRFIRHLDSRRAAYLAVWPVDLPITHWGMTRAQHVAGYFEHERKEARPPNVKWSNFRNSERTIGGVKYPVLLFQVKSKDEKGQTTDANGVFLLLFPEDFEQRQRFFVAMWQEFFPPGQAFSAQSDLHKIVSNVVIGPRAPARK